MELNCQYVQKYITSFSQVYFNNYSIIHAVLPDVIGSCFLFSVCLCLWSDTSCMFSYVFVLYL